MATISEVWVTYERARGRWSGCDWPTRFGSLGLDLKGVSSLQARAATRRWRAIAADVATCAPTTAHENACLTRMALCLRLRCTAWQKENGRIAPMPSRCRCAGALAEEWAFAASALDEIESDARQAEREAWTAVCAAERGDWAGALQHARCASSLESGYLAPRLWTALKTVIEATAAQTGHPLPAEHAESIIEWDGGAILTVQQKERDSSEVSQRETCKTRIAEAVIAALGRPASLWAVHVRWLWADCYRVNVLTGVNPASTLVAHSYFLTADTNGSVLNASPTIERRY